MGKRLSQKYNLNATQYGYHVNVQIFSSNMQIYYLWTKYAQLLLKKTLKRNYYSMPWFTMFFLLEIKIFRPSGIHICNISFSLLSCKIAIFNFHDWQSPLPVLFIIHIHLNLYQASVKLMPRVILRSIWDGANTWWHHCQDGSNWDGLVQTWLNSAILQSCSLLSLLISVEWKRCNSFLDWTVYIY